MRIIMQIAHMEEDLTAVRALNESLQSKLNESDLQSKDYQSKSKDSNAICAHLSSYVIFVSQF